VALVAVFVVLFGLSCTTGQATTSPSSASQELRVDVQWRLDLATDRGWELDAREMGRPVLTPSGDLLIGASNGWVYRIASQSGEIRWARPVGGSIDAPARLDGATVYVGTDAGQLVALDWQDGEESWRFDSQGSIESRPTAADGRIFVTDSDDILYAVDSVTGEHLWEHQQQAPEFFTIKGGGQPLVDGDILYTGFSDGSLVAMYADSGDEIWSAQLGDETGEFGDVDLPIIDRGDTLIATSHAGGIYSVEKESGALMWHVDQGDVTGVTEEQGWLFATTATGAVFAVDTRDGEIEWEFELPDGQSGMDVGLAGPFVTVATAAGPMYWLDLRSGAPVTAWAPSSGFQSTPVFDDQYGYVMSNRGYLYSVSLAF